MRETLHQKSQILTSLNKGSAAYRRLQAQIETQTTERLDYEATKDLRRRAEAADRAARQRRSDEAGARIIGGVVALIGAVVICNTWVSWWILGRPGSHAGRCLCPVHPRHLTPTQHLRLLAVSRLGHPWVELGYQRWESPASWSLRTRQRWGHPATAFACSGFEQSGGCCDVGCEAACLPSLLLHDDSLGQKVSQSLMTTRRRRKDVS